MNKFLRPHHDLEMMTPIFKHPTWIADESAKRRFRIKPFLIGTLIILICGMIIWPLLPRYYQAQTTLIFHAPEQGERVSFLKQDLDEKAIQSELDILASPVLTNEVVKRLGLQTDLEFTAPSTLSPLTLMTHAWSATPPIDAGRSALARLSVQHDRRSYTVRFGYLSKDPQKSSEMTSLLSTLYLDELAARKQKLLARDADVARSRLLSATFRQAQLNTEIEELTKQSPLSNESALMADLITEKTKTIQIANIARIQIEEALARAGNSDSDAEVITPALIPTSPLFPDPLVFAVALSCAALIFGSILGLIDLKPFLRKLKV